MDNAIRKPESPSGIANGTCANTGALRQKSIFEIIANYHNVIGSVGGTVLATLHEFARHSRHKADDDIPALYLGSVAQIRPFYEYRE